MSAKTVKALERSLLDFEVDQKASEVYRAVAVLVHAATEFPYKMVPMNLLVRKARMMTRTPSDDTEEVRIFKANRMSTVRDILLRDHTLGLVASPGFGFRSTVPGDWDDYFSFVATRTARRAGAGNKKLIQVLAPIPPDKLNEDNRRQFRDYKAVSKVLTQGNVVKALLESNATEEK